MNPDRLSVIGFGEYRPAKPNDTVAGRDANRRVVIVILAGEGAPAPSDAADIASEAASAGSSAALPPIAPDVTPITAAPRAAGTEPAPVPASVDAAAGIPAQE
jgi:chemotaxis protein MotB